MTTVFRSNAIQSQGSAVYIGQSENGLPTGSPKTITAITNADPGVVTAVAHGLLEGDVGNFAAIVGMTDLNGISGIVDQPVTDTFEIAGVDTTAMPTYTSGGTFTPFHFIKACELKNFSQTGGQAAEIDVTTLCSVAVEKRIGLQDFGEASMTINYVPGDPALIEIKKAAADGYPRWFKIVFPAGADTMVFQAFVRQVSFSVGVNEAIQGTVSLRLTGAIVELGVTPLPEPVALAA